jgi:hypothetical protein
MLAVYTGHSRARIKANSLHRKRFTHLIKAYAGVLGASRPANCWRHITRCCSVVVVAALLLYCMCMVGSALSADPGIAGGVKNSSESHRVSEERLRLLASEALWASLQCSAVQV